MSARKLQVEGDTSLNLFSVLRTSGLRTAPGQVSPWDCTGCELCVRICPADALKLADAGKVIEAARRGVWGSVMVRAGVEATWVWIKFGRPSRRSVLPLEEGKKTQIQRLGAPLC